MKILVVPYEPDYHGQLHNCSRLPPLRLTFPCEPRCILACKRGDQHEPAHIPMPYLKTSFVQVLIVTQFACAYWRPFCSMQYQALLSPQFYADVDISKESSNHGSVQH